MKIKQHAYRPIECASTAKASHLARVWGTRHVPLARALLICVSNPRLANLSNVIRLTQWVSPRYPPCFRSTSLSLARRAIGACCLSALSLASLALSLPACPILVKGLRYKSATPRACELSSAIHPTQGASTPTPRSSACFRVLRSEGWAF